MSRAERWNYGLTVDASQPMEQDPRWRWCSKERGLKARPRKGAVVSSGRGWLDWDVEGWKRKGDKTVDHPCSKSGRELVVLWRLGPGAQEPLLRGCWACSRVELERMSAQREAQVPGLVFSGVSPTAVETVDLGRSGTALAFLYVSSSLFEQHLEMQSRKRG